MADQKNTFGTKRKRQPKMYDGPQIKADKPRPKHGVETSMGTGQYMAVSKNPRTGKYIRTRHNYREQAIKRLDGNRWHTEKHIYDMGDLPEGYLAVTVETPKKPKGKYSETPKVGGNYVSPE